MNELENQLRSLGEAAQADVLPIAAADVIASEQAVAVTDIGVQQDRPSTSQRKSRRGASLAAAAAVLFVVAVAGVAVLGGSSSEPAVDLASQTHTDTDTDTAIVAPASDNGWAKLRFCESNGEYTTDTGNTFYGAYQFTRRTFNDGARLLAFDDFVGTNPAHAPGYIQDAVANALFLDLGVDPWPVCGRFIDGPMITPVVPQWLDESDGSVLVAVFIDPTSSDTDVTAIAAEIDALLLADPTASYVFIDQDAAFAEFQTMSFGDNPSARASIDASDIPARFNLTTSLPPMLEQLRSIDGVFEVIYPIEPTTGYVQGPLRISIPAIGLSVPVRLSPTIDNQEMGLVAMVNQPDVIALAGFGSFAGSVFDRLDELRDNDTVVISTLVNDGGLTHEIVRTFQVTISSVSGEPGIDDVWDLLLWRRPIGQAQSLILVADVAGQPDKRVVIRANPVEVLDGYVTSDD